MHADVIPFPNFALDLILFALHFAFPVFDLDLAFATSISWFQTLTFATLQLSIWHGLHDDMSALCRFCLMMLMWVFSCELVMLISWLCTCFLSSELHDRCAHVALHDFHSHILILQLRSHPVAVCPWNSLCWLCMLHFYLNLWYLISLLSLHLLYSIHVRSLCADCTLPSWRSWLNWIMCFVSILACCMHWHRRSIGLLPLRGWPLFASFLNSLRSISCVETSHCDDLSWCSSWSNVTFATCWHYNKSTSTQ